MIKLKDLMILERFLLEIETRFKFELKFEEVVELYAFLKEVGRVTNLFFMLQEQYYDAFKDKEKLKEYHDRLLNENVNMNTVKMIGLVKDVCDRFNDEDFREIVTKNNFWESN
jgi:hypothetical protein